jgi:hypothetical protein
VLVQGEFSAAVPLKTRAHLSAIDPLFLGSRSLALTPRTTFPFGLNAPFTASIQAFALFALYERVPVCTAAAAYCWQAWARTDVQVAMSYRHTVAT